MKHKKIIASILSLLILFSAFPNGILTYAAESKTDYSTNLNRDANLNKYLFAYFLGENDTHIRFAVSDDGYNYEALNGNDVLLNTEASDNTAITFNGKSGMPCSGGARDPFILRKQDNSGFWIVATDLDTSVGKSPDGQGGNTYNNSKLLIWNINDISEIGTAKPWAVDTSGWFGDTYYGTDTKNSRGNYTTNNYYNHDGINVNYCAWAPEVIYDTDKAMYMLYWSNGLYDDLRVYYAYTNDFKTFYNSDGKELNGTNGAQPQILYDPHVKSIDGNITYDKKTNKYYMFFKKEAEGQIYIVTSDKASGPYSNEHKFIDENVTGVSNDGNGIGMEGPEVYQLINGEYIFFADVYTNGESMFQFYKNEDLNNISGNDYYGDKMNINHLQPRHAGMTYLDTDEYNILINKYGVCRFSSSGIQSGDNINDDYLVARYFTTEDVTEDATGNGNTLNNHNTTCENKKYNGKDVKTVKSTKENNSYLDISTSQLKNNNSKVNFDLNQGITLSWNSYSENDNNQLYHWIFGILGNGLEKGSLSGSAGDNADKDYLGFCANNVYTLSGGGKDVAIYQADTDMSDAWHKYTITITNKCFVLYKDDKLYAAKYYPDCTKHDYNGKATPCYTDVVSANWINSLFNNGTLLIGASAYGNDGSFTGNIYDFRIYNKALTQKDVNKSTALFNVNSADEALKDYENKMSQGKIYTNMMPAYSAYVKLQKLNDAYKYGTGVVNENDLANCQVELAEAIANMDEYSPEYISQKYADAYTNFKVISDNANYSNYTSQVASRSLLYSGSEQSTNENGKSVLSLNPTYINLDIYYATNVLLYTGSEAETPRFPVAFSWNVNARSTTRYIHSVYPASNSDNSTSNNSSDFKINMPNGSNLTPNSWYGYDERLNYAYTLGNPDQNYRVGADASNSIGVSSARLRTGVLNSSVPSETNYYVSAVEYVGTPKNTVEDYTITWNTRSSNNANNANNVANTDFSSGTANVHTYVINYKQLADAIQNKSSVLSQIDVSDYKEGGLDTLLSAFDNATGLDLSITKTSDIEVLKSKIENVLNDVNKIDTSSCNKDSQEYIDVRNALESSKNIIENNKLDEYTTSSVKEFNGIYLQTQKMIDNVVSNGYIKKAEVERNATALKNVLNQKLDVSLLTEAIEKKDISISENNEQKYTLSSFVKNKKVLQEEKSRRDEMSQLSTWDTQKGLYATSDGAYVSYQEITNKSTNKNLLNEEITRVNTINYDEVSQDYSVYDAFMNVYKTQDESAFTDEYKKLKNSICSLVKLNGSKDFALEYDMENSELQDTAYVKYNGVIYKNTSDIDSKIFNLLTTLNDANTDTSTKRNKYNVTFEIYCDDVLVSSVQSSHYYGDVVNLDTSSVTGDRTCYKWNITSLLDNTGKEYLNNSNSYSLKIQSDSVVKAYYSSDAKENEIPLLITGVYGNTAYEIKVSKNFTIKLDNKKVVIDNQTYELPLTSFYTFKGWKINGKLYDINSELNAKDLIKNDKIVVSGVFEKPVGTYSVSLDGKTVKEKLNFDDKIEVSSPNAYAIALYDGKNYIIVSYGKNYSTYISDSLDLYTVTKENGKYVVNEKADVFSSDEIYKLDNKLPFISVQGFISGENRDKFTTLARISTNSNVTCTEYGIVYTTNKELTDADCFVCSNPDIKTIKSKSLTKTGDIFSITAAGAKKKFEQGTILYTRAYVKYSYEYKNPITGQTSIVQAIEYSDVLNDALLF